MTTTHRHLGLADELWTAPPITPYTSPLEHLADCIDRVRDLAVARELRKPEESPRSRGVDRDSLLERMKRTGDTSASTKVRAVWEVADRKLAWTKAREALTLEAGRTLPIVKLTTTFGLSQLELDVLLFAAAPKIDTRCLADWNAMDHDLVDPNVGTAIALFARTFDEGIAMRWVFSLKARLIESSLLLAEGHRGASESDFLTLTLQVPRRIIAELLGEAALDDDLVAFSRVRRGTVPLSQVVLPAETKELVVSLVKSHGRFLERRRAWGLDEVVSYGRALVLLFAGPPGTGKTMLANAVAHELGRPLFSVDVAKLMEQGRTIEANLDAVFREARLLDAVLFFDECEQIFASRRLGNDALATLLTRIEQVDGIAILATNMESTLDEALSRRVVARVAFEPPTRSARAEIWNQHMPPALPRAACVDVERLAEDHELSGGTIKNAVLAAVVRATSRDASELSMADLEHGARLQVRVTSDVAAQLVSPEARLDDLVLPADVRQRVDKLVAGAKVRSTVLSEWGFGKTLGRATGLAALFSGPPGTGKTATAEAVAHALGRPVLRCSLPSVISKWVGETSKNLAQLFVTAREQRAVLLFDEADALFARRVRVESANDRFANAESAALLREMETFSGVVILTTNLAVELDPAFDRRLHVRVTFAQPDARARAAIWRKLLPADAPLAGDVDVVRLARDYALSGGMIRNAVMSAALEAAGAPAGQRVISQRMLQRAALEQGGEAVREPESAGGVAH